MCKMGVINKVIIIQQLKSDFVKQYVLPMCNYQKLCFNSLDFANGALWRKMYLIFRKKVNYHVEKLERK